MNIHDENYKSRMAGVLKWLLPILAFAIVGILTAGLLLGWYTTKDAPTMSEVGQSEQAGVVDGDGNFMEVGKVYPMPTAMAFSSEKLAAALASESSVDVKISATVTPLEAANQAVDFSVAWGAAPTNGTNAVTDYVTVTPDSDGSTKATVSCKKAFGSDQIIITVTTRDGGYTATCTVTFIGKASNMSITSSTLTPKSNSGRESYFEVGTGNTYTFAINLSNIFGTVGSKNLSAKVGASGSLYFGKQVSSADGGSFSDMAKKDLSTMADQFITSATISEPTLTIRTGSKIVENYYSSQYAEFGFSICEDRYVYDDGLGAAGWTYGGEANAATNAANLPNCYFTVTVTDSVSGLSQTVRLWLVSSVSGVSLSQNTLSF